MRRALWYLLAAVVGSSIGSMWTWTTDEWADANPLTSGPRAALLSLGPAIAIVALARLSPSILAGLAGLMAAAMTLMWWLFATNDSSTSGLVFLWGWLLGVPAALGIVALDRHRTGDRSSKSSPASRGARRHGVPKGRAP